MISSLYKYISIQELEKTFDMENMITLHMIRKACRMLNIDCRGGGVVFIDPSKQNENETELEQLHRSHINSIHNHENMIVLYQKVIKPNTKYIYYKIVEFRGNDMNDVKKILKVNKLKAFI